MVYQLTTFLSRQLKPSKDRFPLDEIHPECWPSQFTTELLELLWVLEATIAVYPQQAELLGAIIRGDCFKANEMPDVPEDMKKLPKTVKHQDSLFEAFKDK